MITAVLYISLYLLFSSLNEMQEALFISNRAKFQQAFQVAALSGLISAAAVACLMGGHK